MRINTVTVASGQQSKLIELIKADPDAHARTHAQRRRVELIHTKKLSGFTENWLPVKALKEAKNTFFPHALCHIKYL